MGDHSRILIAGLDNNRGGTENVINNYVSALSDDFQFDFLLYEDPWYESPRLENNRFFIIPRKQNNLLGFKRGLKKFFDAHGDEYHTLWMNFNNLSNIDVLAAAAKQGIPRRIAHGHSSSYSGGIPQQMLSMLHNGWYKQYVTDRWACSKEAGLFYFKQESFEIVPIAIDYGEYAFSPSDRDLIRLSLEVGDSLLLGTVGRLDRVKNHAYLLALLLRVKEKNEDIKLLIVGDGPCKNELKQRAHDLGIEDAVYFVGAQSDVRAYLSAMDVFLFPSLSEGFGLSLIEAQVNGLPCLVSEHISSEAVISSAVKSIPLVDISLWRDMALKMERPLENPLSYQYDLGLQGQELLKRLKFFLSQAPY